MLDFHREERLRTRRPRQKVPLHVERAQGASRMTARRRLSNLNDVSIDNLFDIAAGLDQSEFLEILFNVAAEMAEEGVSADEIAISCGRVCTRLGIDLKRILN